MKPLKYYFDRAVETYEKAGKIQKKVAEEVLKKLRKNIIQLLLKLEVEEDF